MCRSSLETGLIYWEAAGGRSKEKETEGEKKKTIKPENRYKTTFREETRTEECPMSDSLTDDGREDKNKEDKTKEEEGKLQDRVKLNLAENKGKVKEKQDKLEDLRKDGPL